MSRNIKDKIWPAEKSTSKKADKQTSLKWNGSILQWFFFQQEYYKSNTFLIVLSFIFRRVYIFSMAFLLIANFLLPRPVVYNSEVKNRERASCSHCNFPIKIFGWAHRVCVCVCLPWRMPVSTRATDKITLALLVVVVAVRLSVAALSLFYKRKLAFLFWAVIRSMHTNNHDASTNETEVNDRQSLCMKRRRRKAKIRKTTKKSEWKARSDTHSLTQAHTRTGDI